jgi:S1-C subfamily serine protease
MKGKKKIIILMAVIIVIAAAIVITTILVKPKKQETKPTENQVQVINKTTLLDKADSAQAAELIKQNIVKITNEVKGTKVTGTGFFHETGYLVTNSHVVDLKGTIKVTYHDGTTTNATLVANDMTSDIAILSVEEQKALALTFGSTLTLKVTDELYAIGYPFALEGEATTTKGILSARRSAGGIEYLQTDMSLNTGNSGGPLINAKAEVFGMTTYATENASLGMSISAESLESIIQKLITNKETKYLETDREPNALSTVLTEIGHKDEDIYDEKEILDKVFEREQPKVEEQPKEEAKPVVKKSGDNTIKKLTINGKVYKVTKDDCIVSYKARRQSLEPLDIKVETNHPKAKVKIEGNRKVQAGTSNIVNITVTAENGSKWIYDIKITTSTPTMERLAKVNIYTSIEHDYNIGANVLKFNIEGQDSDGLTAGAGSNSIIQYEEPFTKLTVKLYVEVHKPTGMERRALKTYTFNDVTGNEYVKLSEVKSLLVDEDFFFGETQQDFAFTYIEATVETVSQGTFTYSGSGPNINK